MDSQVLYLKIRGILCAHITSLYTKKLKLILTLQLFINNNC